MRSGAFRVPNMLRDLFAEGNFNSAFLPVPQKSLKIGEKRTSGILRWFIALLLTSSISVLIFIFPEIVEVLSFQEARVLGYS